MRFVTIDTAAGKARGFDLAAELGASCGFDLGEPEPGEWVIFVKTLKGADEAKRRGCMVAFDPVDLFSRDDVSPSHWPGLDAMVVYGTGALDVMRHFAPNADFVVAPHQWDPDIAGRCVHDKFLAGYIGSDFNLREALDVPRETVFEKQLDALPLFNCHVAEHAGPRGMMFKPATKVASAAAVGAVVVSTVADSAMYLLGEEYPYFANEGQLCKVLETARREFGGPVWYEAQQQMAMVREATSIKAVADLYRQAFSGS